MRPKGQVSEERVGGGGGGGSFGCLRLSPLKWLEMHLKLTWYGETSILLATKNVALKKKTFLHNRSTLFDNGSLAPCRTKAADARTKEKENRSFTFIAVNVR